MNRIQLTCQMLVVILIEDLFAFGFKQHIHITINRFYINLARHSLNLQQFPSHPNPSAVYIYKFVSMEKNELATVRTAKNIHIEENFSLHLSLVHQLTWYHVVVHSL